MTSLFPNGQSIPFRHDRLAQAFQAALNDYASSKQRRNPYPLHSPVWRAYQAGWDCALADEYVAKAFAQRIDLIDTEENKI